MNATRRKTTDAVPDGAGQITPLPRTLLLLAAALLGTAQPVAQAAGHAAATATDARVANGAYLATAAGCISCHTDSEHDGAPWAGGHALETPYGTFYAPNITPDKETGIGRWTDDEFVAAVKHGVAPGGGQYYPAFPYPSYAGMTDTDALAIKAYLDTLVPVSQPNRPHELEWYVPGRTAMQIWAWLFAPWDYAAAPSEHERGAYLVRHLGHCGECHTPRNLFGALDTAAELGGSPADAAGGSAPAIDATALAAAGWTRNDLEFFLELGMLPDGDFAGGGMTAVIDDNTGKLTPADRAAIAGYLLQAGN